MELLLLLLLTIIVVYVSVERAKKLKAKQALAQIKADWQSVRPKKGHYNFLKIDKYLDTSEAQFHRLTDQTLEDLDFEKLFKFIDRTTSKVGQQFLYKKLLEPTNQIQNESEKYINLFAENKKLREEVQAALLKLSNEDAYSIASLLSEAPLIKPKWFKFLKLDLAIIVLLFVLAIKFPASLIFLILPFSVNVYLHLWNKNNTFHYFRSVPQLLNLIHVAETLAKSQSPIADKVVLKSVQRLSTVKKNARLIKFNEGGLQNEVGQYLSDLFKSLFLVEILTTFKISEELKDKKSDIHALFRFVGHLDACISIASLRGSKLNTCKPTFTTSKKELYIKGAYHPLLKKGTPNDLTIKDKSALITGSNMSGKSTFLRTVAINSILAQTIYTCFAEEYTAPILKPFSSIRIDDDLFQGKSYFFEEVGVMGSLIEATQGPAQCLFLLDEVFKGTNTIERVAAAKAILSYLNRGDNIVLVATHDIELADMLNDDYDLYHFTEIIENNKLHFDHTIKPGALKTRNAIKLLELAEYPTEVLDEAKRISALYKS
ncbi:MAG: DNA mismatch repair protein MutS [Bacteroidota bacterium]